MSEEKIYSQAELNETVTKAICDMTEVLKRKDADIKRLEEQIEDIEDVVHTRYRYNLAFVGGMTSSFETDEEIDFYTLKNSPLVFSNIYINNSNLLFIEKEIIKKEASE